MTDLARYVRLTAVSLAVGAFCAASFGGACNETVGPKDPDAETGQTGGPATHPSLGEDGNPKETKVAAPLGPGEVPMGTFDFALREGTPDAGKKPLAPAAEAKPTSDAEAQQILD